MSNGEVKYAHKHTFMHNTKQYDAIRHFISPYFPELSEKKRKHPHIHHIPLLKQMGFPANCPFNKMNILATPAYSQPGRVSLP
jgi:hypothetical protein